MIGGFTGGLSSAVTFGITKWLGAFKSIPVNSFISNFISSDHIDLEKFVTHIWSSLLLQYTLKTTVGADILTEATINLVNYDYGDPC